MPPPALEALLDRNRSRLNAFVRSHAGALLGFEGVDDLRQGIEVRALEQRGRFEYRSDPEFVAWLFTLARAHLADRHDYWTSLKRRSGKVLRYTVSQGRTGVRLPASTRTGPGTFAERRELLQLATRALASLPDRDRELVQMHSEQVPLDEQAERLCISYAAAQKASLRAQERLRKTFELLLRS
jgi:RNA polymerase sigma factor (sigma-70 family)